MPAPEIEDEGDDAGLCPFCGAYGTRTCDLIDDAGFCPWEEMDE